MKRNKSKLAIITGATSGIGLATAKMFAKGNYNLVITGRREEKLEDVKQNLISEYSIDVMALMFDVRDREQSMDALNGMPEKWKNPDILINNAGLASGLEGIQEGSFDDWDRMIDTNVKGLLNISRTVIPWMIKNKKGHIVNLGSVADREVYPGGNVYCASKHAVRALSDGMRIDLNMNKIKVTNIAPGLVETEFSLVRFHGNADKAKVVYDNYTPLSPHDIAECIWFAASRPAHVMVADMLVFPTAQANSTTVLKE